MRARKISNRGGFKVIGKFPSNKLGRMVWFESQLERDYCYQLEYDKDVTSYSEQPFKLAYTLDGKRRRYTPDFLVYRDGCCPLVIEVKPERKTMSDEFKAFERAVRDELENQGSEFRIVTCTHIQREPQLSNIKRLYPSISCNVPVKIIEYIRELAQASESLTISVLRHVVPIGQIHALMFQGVLRFDINIPINDDTKLNLR